MFLRARFLTFAILGALASSALSGAAEAKSVRVSGAAPEGFTIAAQGVRDPAVQRALAELQAEAAKSGSVDIVVKTAVPFAPETLLGEAERQQQRRDIAAAAQRLRKAVPQAQDFTAEEDKPYVRLRASQEALARLAAAPGVARIMPAASFNWARDFVRLRSGGGALSPPPGVSPRIVGGREADPDTHPFQVGLLLADTGLNAEDQFCGGSLISDRYVLTAAHCSDFITDPSTVEILAGTQLLADENGRNAGGERVAVKQIHVHPRWNSDTSNFDVALWELEQPLTGAPTATLAATPPSVPGTLLRVTGWGATSYMGDSSAKLLQVDVPFVPTVRRKCQQQRGVTPQMICAGAGGVDSCQGDSGGPLTINRGAGFTELVGVVSFGFECAISGYPGVYANVADAEIAAFIRDVAFQPKRISFQSSTASVNEGARSVTLTLGRDFTDVPASVRFTAWEDTANRADFSKGYGTVTFRKGSATAQVTIRITDDRLKEGPENFYVVLSSPTRGALGTDVAQVTIIDND